MGEMCGDTFLIEVLNSQITSILEQQGQCSKKIKIIEKMLLILKDYKYVF